MSSTGAMARVLVVDDDRDLCTAIAEGLEPRGFRFSYCDSAEEALATLESPERPEWDIVVADVRMNAISGLALCERIVTSRPSMPVVLMTAFPSLAMAVAAMRAGAYDFIVKPFELNVLALALDRAVRHRRLHAEAPRPPGPVTPTIELDGIVGACPRMRRVFDLIARVADTEVPVLVSGESGTGKELVARSLHKRSRRGGGPFVVASCAAIPLESELFGHVEGAFPGAGAAQAGLFVEASGGTLFLDEIADLSLDLQSKLLQVLQDRTVRPVGGDRDEPHDARIIAATKHDLETEVRAHRFREDLFYRIHVIPIDLPPLRERGDDILVLAQHFLVRAAAELGRPVRGLGSAATALLQGYGWPGNVRELENCIVGAVAMARGTELAVDDLPDGVRNHQVGGRSLPEALPVNPLSLEEVERRHILRVLAAVGGRRVAAAEVLGLHPSTLYRKLEQYGLGRGGHAGRAPQTMVTTH